MCCRSQYELEEDVIVPNETLYSSLKYNRSKRPFDQKQKFWHFWPFFGQIQHFVALIV